ncbi:MAG: DUF6498-containing protein [Bdellovibrionales bacterium]|jgi:hypothetical protein|nr:DUF6498-containing protein [Bdellovibrionales bacterium]
MKLPHPQTPSEIFLVIANILPLVGVLLWGWKVFDVMLLYWLENVIIGIFHVMKMIETLRRKNWWPAFPIVIFFIFHYGMFCAGHGVFVLVLFGLELRDGDTASWEQAAALMGATLSDPLFMIATAGLVASHGYSFFANFIGKGEVDRVNATLLLAGPYARIVVLHITLIVGGGLAIALGQPAWALALLTLLKTCGDMIAHRRSHAKAAAAPVQTTLHQPRRKNGAAQ